MHLECSHIVYRYPGADRDLFTDLSFQMTEPGFNAMFGPSGVGKTSLAKIIAGQIETFGGTVDSGTTGNVLYSHNQERLPGWSSVSRNIDKSTPPHRREQRDELVDAFGIDGCMDSRFTQLSLGQKNRVNLLRYLLQDFDLLIMDESLANVDERTREIILLKIKAMFPHMLFLYISHNVVEVSKFCREIIVFRTAGSRPQVVGVRGQDARTDRPADRDLLQGTMLEIMNAS